MENGKRMKIIRILTNTRVSIKTIKSMDKDNSNGNLAIIISVNTKTTKDMDMEKCFGLTVQLTKGIGSKVCSMDLVKFSYKTELLKKENLKEMYLLKKSNKTQKDQFLW